VRPYYERKGVQLYLADCRDVLPHLARVDHVITDPPYSEHVHGKQRRMLRGAGRGLTKSGKRAEVGFAPLGFDALDEETRRKVAAEVARLCKRWCLVFSDAESVNLWRDALRFNGMRHIREGAWVKLAGQPQLSGDRPAVGFEAIEISHSRARTRWNNGGHPAVWSHPIATDRNGTGERVHTAQKPLPLMLELVRDFTNPGETILDAFAGSCTTGVACMRLGRSFVGIERVERYAEVAARRLEAESQGLSLRALTAGQLAMFPPAAGGTP
jgi:site-specific DNA-methyltransferase (adenine-specific)